MGKASKIFFPNLNGLRFIAAFVVIIHHLEQNKLFFGAKSWFQEIHCIKLIGELGVTLFFVLSGFLITYLLLAEKERFNTVDIKKFYIRRVLRIWPLYYLVVIMGLFVLPHIPFFHVPEFTEQVHYKFGTKIALYLFLLPNLVNNLYAYMPFIAQAWSIGIEEQFYYIWPWMVRYTDHYLRTLIGIVIGMLMITISLSFFADKGADLSSASTEAKVLALLYRFFSFLRIGCMAIGGIGAYYLYYLKINVLRPIFHPVTQIVTTLTVLTMTLLGVEIPVINHEFYSLFFIIIILNFAANPNCLVSLENKTLDYLGKISYSLYMWHGVAILISLRITQLMNPKIDDFSSNAVYYGLAMLISVGFAMLSYEYFETKFLKFKPLFVKIDSGSEAQVEKAPTPLEKGVEMDKKVSNTVTSKQPQSIFTE
jgi:peptidoglycan/LPS O-acetylase OafA/YrhL